MVLVVGMQVLQMMIRKLTHALYFRVLNNISGRLNKRLFEKFHGDNACIECRQYNLLHKAESEGPVLPRNNATMLFGGNNNEAHF